MAYKDPEVRRAKQRESYHKNRDIHLKKHKEYYVKNKDSCLQKAKEYKEKNKEYFQEYLRDYREKNREKNKEYQREYHTKNKKSLRAKAGQYRKKKRAIDPIFRLTDNLRGRFGIVISGRSKSKSVLSLLGCSVEQFKKHIEEQFTEGMNWENYGQMGHHIDHILDCRFFDLTKIEEL